MPLRPLILPAEVGQLARPCYADEALLTQIIAESEREDIRPRIGATLFVALKSTESDADLTGSLRILLLGGEWTDNSGRMHYLDGIKVALAYYTYGRVIRDGNITSTRYGAVIKSDDNSNSASDNAERQRQYRQAFDTADTMIVEAVNYITAMKVGGYEDCPGIRSNRAKMTVIGSHSAACGCESGRTTIISGKEGPSAYDVAVANGFRGSVEDWLASLVGPQGPEGPQGPQGPSVSLDDYYDKPEVDALLADKASASDVEAAISEEAAARENGDQSLGTQIAALENNLGESIGNIEDKVDDVSASLAVVQSDLEAEQAARVAADAALGARISNEEAARKSSDGSLSASIADEATKRGSEDSRIEGLIGIERNERAAADAALELSKQDAISDLETIRSNAQNASNTIASIVNAGYVFAGVATSSTNPGIPDAKVFYIANGKGTYGKFGGLEVTEDEVVVLYWDTAWHKVSTGIASQEKLSELEGKANSVRSQILSFVDFGEKLSVADFPTVGGLSPNGDINPAYTEYRVSRIYCLENVESIYYIYLSALNTALAGIVLYDSDLNVIASLDGNASQVTELDLSPYQNASYVRFCGYSTGLSLTILYDNNIARKLISYNDIEKVKGYYIGIYGSVYAHENYIYFSIPCKYGMKLSFPQFYSEGAGCCFYAPNGNAIEYYSLEGQRGSEITLTAPSDAYVLKVSCFYLDEISFYVRENIGSLVTSPTNGSIDKLKTNFIIHDDDTDFIPEWIPNTFINQNGVQTNATGLYSTGKVYLQEGINYYWRSLINGYYAFYREDGSLIEGHPNNDESLSNPFSVPIGTSYGRFTAPNESYSKRAFISVRNFKPSPMTYKLSDSIMTDGGTFCNYKGNEICMFNRGLAIGDSLTEGVFNHNEGGTMQYLVDTKYSYPAILKKISGVDIVNKGVGGYTSDDWYNRFKNEDLSGFDFAIIQLGVNDLSRYGSWTSTTETAYTNIINKLKAENKNIKIFVATLIPAKNYFSANFIAFSDSIRAFVASLNDANVILEDIAIYGHGKDSDAYNAGHLSALGYCRLAEDHKNLISYLISLDRNNYRYVQFIGTDYSYSD